MSTHPDHEESDESFEEEDHKEQGVSNSPFISGAFSMKDLQHPLFSIKGNPILTFFQGLKKKRFQIDMDKSQIIEKFAALIFDGKNPSQLTKLYEKKGLSFDSTCGRTIPLGTAFYMCLDCDKLRKCDSTLVCCLCRECFLNSDHTGHRVLLATNTTGELSVCDCGNSAAFEPCGFCEEHSKKPMTFEAIVEAIGPKTVKTFNETFFAMFYGIFSLMELETGLILKLSKAEDKTARKFAEDIMMVFCGIMAEIVEFFNMLISINSGFIPIIANLLQSTLPEGLNTLMHHCNEQKLTIFSPTEHKCTCTIGELLFKNILLVFQELMQSFPPLFNHLFKFDPFKPYITRIFVQNIYFLFHQNNPNMRSISGNCSILVDCTTNFFTDITFCNEAVRNGNMQNLFDLFHAFIDTHPSTSQSFNYLVNRLCGFLELLMRPKSEGLALLFTEHKIPIQFLNLLVKFVAKFPFTGTIFTGMTTEDAAPGLIYNIIRTEQSFEHMFKRTMIQMVELSAEDKERTRNELIERWKQLFEEQNNKQSFELNFTSVLERAAYHYILGSEMTVTKEKVLNFLEKLPKENLMENAELLLSGNLKQIGALRRFYTMNAFMQKEISLVYYNDDFGSFEIDMVGMQMLIPCLSSETAYQYLVKNYFQYSANIQEFMLQNEGATFIDKEEMIAIEDFLGVLVFCMIDESCLLKLRLTKTPRSYSDELEFADDLQRVTRKVLVSLLAALARNPVETGLISGPLKGMLYELNIDMLPEFAIKDEKMNTVKVKEELQGELDLFQIIPRRHMWNEVLNKLRGNFLQEKIDIVSGKYYTDLPRSCYETQKVLFESQLPRFLVKVINRTEKQTDVLLGSVLRLVLMHLQCIPHLGLLGFETEKIVENAKGYLGPEFLAGLEKIRQNGDLADYHLVVGKIEQALEKNLGRKEGEQGKAEEKIEYLDSQKKKIAEEKQKAFMQKFLDKQKAFLEKQGDVLKAQTEEVKQEDEEEHLQCNLCLYRINPEKELYGTPCYISFANHFEMDVVKIHNHSEEIFPVLHGCGHQLHTKCFMEWKAKTQQEQGAYKEVLNSLETYCPLCKNIVNVFCPANQRIIAEEAGSKKIEGAEIGSESMLQTLAEFTNAIYQRVEKFMEGKNDVPKNEEAEIEQGIYSLRNMFWFYLETVDFSNPDLVKQFKLYAGFLAAVKVLVGSYKVEFEKFRKNEVQEGDLVTVENIFVMNMLNEILFSSGENSKERLLSIMMEYLGVKFEETFIFSALFKKKFKPQGNKVDHVLSALKTENEKAGLVVEVNAMLKRLLILFALGDYIFDSESAGFGTLKIIQETEEDNIENFLHYLKIGTLEDLLKQSLNAKDFISSKQRAVIQGSILGLNEGVSLTAKYLIVPHIKPFKFEFPANYQLFIDKYMGHVCEECENLPKHGEKVICLICGAVICKGLCVKKKKALVGMCNLHSLEHCGLGMFLEVYILRLFLVNVPKNIIVLNNSIYVDDLGQACGTLVFNPYDKRLDAIDFTKFKLNTQTAGYLEKVINEARVPLEFFKRVGGKVVVVGDGFL